jgi:hypothetical protein
MDLFHTLVLDAANPRENVQFKDASRRQLEDPPGGTRSIHDRR